MRNFKIEVKHFNYNIIKSLSHNDDDTFTSHLNSHSISITNDEITDYENTILLLANNLNHKFTLWTKISDLKNHNYWYKILNCKRLKLNYYNKKITLERSVV